MTERCSDRHLRVRVVVAPGARTAAEAWEALAKKTTVVIIALFG